MNHCNCFRDAPRTRRDFLKQASAGFGAVAMAALMGESAYGSAAAALPTGEGAGPHFTPKAKRVIFLYMDGGVSQVDSFDPKPRLTKENGNPFPMKMEPTQFDNNGNTLGTLWDFKNYGQSGLPVSSLFPHVGECADDLCVVRSMVSNFSEHNAANYFLHTGLGQSGRPSMGAWSSYGLGAETKDLPGYIVLNGGLIPSGGVDNFGAGFLPATYQASIMRAADPALANIKPLEGDRRLQDNKLQLMNALDGVAAEEMGRPDAVESAIENYELAYRMQAAIPELMDIKGESDATKKLYGLDDEYEHTRSYAAQCLVARRLVERGVRFIELTCPPIKGSDRWDAHGGLKENHTNNSRAVDKPIAGLLKDLKGRGLLKDTLVVWTGEFGRTPFAQGTNGRDHNPFGFTLWMAGGGVKPGMVYGATDEFGYKVVDGKMEIHDLHATMLHLLGFDHTKLTYRFGGRDMRLTDVHGNVVKELLA
jgi:hypothetical protein